MSDNIFPVADRAVGRAPREAAQGHRGGVFWLTGLSGAGKSTIALACEHGLYREGMNVVMLDGDDVRTGLCGDLGFSMRDREENVRRIAEVAKLFANTGAIVLACFVSPTRAIRSMARTIIGADDFYEVYVDADLATCEARDVKGLYAKARAGEIKGFTGIGSPYEVPEHPSLQIKTAEADVSQSASRLASHIRLQTKL